MHTAEHNCVLQSHVLHTAHKDTTLICTKHWVINKKMSPPSNKIEVGDISIK